MFALCGFIGCVCVLCECSFIGASKQPSIDPLDLLDVFVGALHVLSVPCTLCIHWLALTMKQSVYLLCACYALDH